ncbi:MAG: hypothetical protein HUU11_08525 [Anaerolineales bacterium]|nr:hypothetical protein [Anaerolineales bacterium]
MRRELPPKIISARTGKLASQKDISAGSNKLPGQNPEVLDRPLERGKITKFSQARGGKDQPERDA